MFFTKYIFIAGQVEEGHDSYVRDYYSNYCDVRIMLCSLVFF